jgi:valyl-tRNA synthetase
MTMLAGAMLPEAGPPFRDVYIHGLVRDENNRKMSKSAGNGIDPLLLIERYGADALRFALVREVAGAGQDIRLDYDRASGSSATVEAARNFANKLFNATRFALMNLGGETPASLGEPTEGDCEGKYIHRWILSRLNRVNRETAKRYKSYELGEAAKNLYEFAWNDVCDCYIEFAKECINKDGPDSEKKLARKVLAKVMNDLLVMLYPLLPHLCEELWHGLNQAPESKLLSLQLWPVFDEGHIDDALEDKFQESRQLISIGRNLRAEKGLKPSQKVEQVGISTTKDELRKMLEVIKPFVASQLKSFEVKVLSSDLGSDYGVVGFSGSSQIGINMPRQDSDALRARLEKDLAKAEKEIADLSTRLSNPNFVSKAPPNVVATCQANLAEAEAQALLVRGRLAELG